MRSGITPVIAVVLLLTMTVGAAGGAYTWFTQVQEEAQERTDTSMETRVTVKEMLCDRGMLRLGISNTGDRVLSTGRTDLLVSRVGGDLVAAREDVNLSGGSIAPGEFARSTLFIPAALAAGQRYEVELLFPADDYSVTASCTGDPGAVAVGAWSFDGTVEDVARDNDGSVSTTAYVSGKFGQAHNRSAGSRVVVADSSSLDQAFGGDEISISVWVKPENASDWQDIVEKGGDRVEFGGSGDPTDDIWATVYNTTGGRTCNQAVYEASILDVGAWNHVIYTYSTDMGEERVWVNGSIVGSRSCTETIGSDNNDLDLADHAFDGIVDEIQIYPVAVR